MSAFGILTLATPADYPKAIGLALSLRISNPGVPTAVACSAAVGVLLQPFFDHVIAEHPGVRGFRHKVHLDEYTPFERTFFLDSDVLVFRALQPYVDHWGDPAYAATGGYVTGGCSAFGFDRARFLGRVGRPRLVCIDGAGHACFRRPACLPLFTLARDITAHYAVHAGAARYADEDAVAMAMTLLDLPPAPYGDFMARCLSAVPGTLRMDARRGVCTLRRADNGARLDPCMVHFAANEAPLFYTGQLLRLYRSAGLPVWPVLRLGARDLCTAWISDPLSHRIRRWRQRHDGLQGALR